MLALTILTCLNRNKTEIREWEQYKGYFKKFVEKMELKGNFRNLCSI